MELLHPFPRPWSCEYSAAENSIKLANVLIFPSTFFELRIVRIRFETDLAAFPIHPQ